MPSRTWTLTDVAREIHESDFCITAKDLPAAAGAWRVSQRVLHGGLSDGVDLVEIDNGRMRFMVIPTRGMGIWQAQMGDEMLGWRSPVRGPVHPKWVPLLEPGGLGWLEGFDELLVRCGLESNGAPEFDERGQLVYPLHGRIANRPAHQVEVTVDSAAGTISLRGVVEETRFHFQKLRLVATITTAMDSHSFEINDSVENFGGTPAEMQMLYHINVGQPQLAAGHRLVAPVEAIKNRDSGASDSTAAWDLYGPPVAGQSEQCFYIDLLGDEMDRTQVLLKNAQGTAGVAVGFNNKSLPCFTLWKNLVASQDGYVTGLEPGTNFPNTRSQEAQCGRVIPLAAGETWSTELEIDWLTSAAAVTAVEAAIRQLTSNFPPPE